MASIKKSISRLYMGESIVPFHIFFLFLSAIGTATFFSLGLNPLPLLIYSVAALIVSGFFFKIANTRLNYIDELPELDESVLMALLKFIPVGIFIFILILPLAIIPILGTILEFIFNLTVSPVVTMAFCKDFDIKAAVSWQKIKEYSPRMIGPALMLGLKLFLLVIFELIMFGATLFIFAKENPFVIVTTIFYIMIINQFIYADSLAQIYDEITVENQEVD